MGQSAQQPVSAPAKQPTPVVAADVCAKISLPSAARKLLREGMTPSAYVQELLKGSHNVPAIDFLAHALGPRETIWWGCLCMQHAVGDKLQGAEKLAARAAVMWVMQPTDENRAAAKTAAQAAGTSIGGRLALAASQTTVPTAPPGGEWAKTVADAVKIATTKFATLKISGTQAQFAALGLAIGVGSLG